MRAFFGHDGGVTGWTTTHGTDVPPGPSSFAHAQSQASMGQAGPTVRRPTSLHLRGSLLRGGQANDWSATGEPSPVEGATGHAPATVPGPSVEFDSDDPRSPVEEVTMHQVMQRVHETYDMNVMEADHFEWLLQSGLLPTIGHVWDVCNALRFQRKSPTQSPAQPAAPLPSSWTQGGSYQSPQRRRPEAYDVFTKSPAGQSRRHLRRDSQRLFNRRRRGGSPCRRHHRLGSVQIRRGLAIPVMVAEPQFHPQQTQVNLP